MQFSTSTRTALFGLCLSALSAAAAPSLSVAVAGSSSFAGVQNFQITTSVANTGDETLKLLKDPATVLVDFPTDSFTIESDDGVVPEFTGAIVKFGAEFVVKNNVEDAFVYLKPGESLQVTHDLSTAYDFTNSGAGAYKISPRNAFLYVDPTTGEIVELEAAIDAPLASNFSGALAHKSASLDKRASYSSCSSTQISQLESAQASALTYANNAVSYLTNLSSGSTRYVSWFGTYDATRKAKVLSNYKAIAGYPFQTSGRYSCACTMAGTYAYITRSDYGLINLCPVFWQTGATGTDSRAGTLIHESSHFSQIANTNDVVYGQSGARSLAKSNPASAITNADSHEYFAENTPAES